MFDLTNKNSFLDAKKWYEELIFLAGEGVQVLLAGNKLDLVKQDPKRREVETKEAEKFGS